MENQSCCTSPVSTVIYSLVLIGAINWGLVGLGMLLGSNLNVVNLLVGSYPLVEAIVYLAVGVAAIYNLVVKFSSCK